MRKLALLFLVLPIPALATPTTDLRMHQAAEARADCTAHNQGPESRHYAACVNSYLSAHYGWRVAIWRDGSFHVQPDGLMWAPAGSPLGSSVNGSNSGQNILR